MAYQYKKHYTRDEARALLPEVRQWLSALSKLRARLSEFSQRLTDIEPPESLVQSDLQRRVEGTVRQLQAQGISMDQWMSATGQDARHG